MPKLKQKTTDTAPTLFDVKAYQTIIPSYYDWEDCEDGDEPGYIPEKKPAPVEEEFTRAQEAEKCRKEFINYLSRQGLQIQKIYNITLTKKGVPVISYITLSGKKASTFLPKKLLSDAIFGMCNTATIWTTDDLAAPTVSNIRETKNNKARGFIWKISDGETKYKDETYGAFDDLCTQFSLIYFLNNYWLNLDAMLLLRPSLVPTPPAPAPKPAPPPVPAFQPKQKRSYKQLSLFDL